MFICADLWTTRYHWLNAIFHQGNSWQRRSLIKGGTLATPPTGHALGFPHEGTPRKHPAQCPVPSKYLINVTCGHLVCWLQCKPDSKRQHGSYNSETGGPLACAVTAPSTTTLKGARFLEKHKHHQLCPSTVPGCLFKISPVGSSNTWILLMRNRVCLRSAL